MKTTPGHFVVIVLCTAVLVLPQKGAGQLAQGAPSAESSATIHVDVNELLIPVVVRDAHGQAVGDLSKSDFKVYDQGKEQAISGFTILNSAISGGIAPDRERPAAGSTDSTAANAAPPTTSQPGVGEQRSIVFLFDDRHLDATDLVQVKKAGIQMLNGSLGDSDRAVVLSFLGVNSGLTHDRAALQAAIMKLKPQEVFQHDTHQCPNIDYYEADQILNKHSPTAYQIAVQEAANCTQMATMSTSTYPEMLVRTAAALSLQAGESDSRETLAYIRGVVQTMSKLPGQRILILVSPGFLSASDEAMTIQSQILDLAASSNVTISALGAQGLYSGITAANQTGSSSVLAQVNGQILQDHRYAMEEGEAVMAELADGTGGTFLRNSNDLEAGLKSLTVPPAHLYLLGISLSRVKLNGTYHKLQVKIDRDGLKLQARKGYFAPKAEKSKH